MCSILPNMMKFFWHSFGSIQVMETQAEKIEMNTLVSCLNGLMKEGFDKQFKVTKEGIKELSSEKIYSPEEVKVLNFYRFEGNSDPADNSILYAIETVDGKRGTLVDAYGPYSDMLVAAFMKRVEDIQKNSSGKPS